MTGEADRLDPSAPPDLEGLPVPITAEWAWGESRGAGVRVAVIDSGVDAAHPAVGELQGYVAFEYDPAADTNVRRIDGPHDDVVGHGTACAAIIRSLAPDCELHSVRVLGANNRTRGFVFAEGLGWSVDAGMQVVNMSLSSSAEDLYARFHALADAAYFGHTMLVCALNNMAGPSYPSQYASVISVAAMNDPDPYAYTYNPDGPAEFRAPGVDLDVAWRDGSYTRSTGSSFAAPHIAGLVTRILSKHPRLTPFQIKTILHALARRD